MPVTYASYNPAFLEVLSILEELWDGNLERIKAAVHFIELIPSDTPPIHSVPYRAGPKAANV